MNHMNHANPLTDGQTAPTELWENGDHREGNRPAPAQNINLRKTTAMTTEFLLWKYTLEGVTTPASLLTSMCPQRNEGGLQRRTKGCRDWRGPGR